MAFVRVASLAELPENETLAVEAEGKAVCLANCEGEVYAFQDNCTHRDFPLSSGELDPEECSITCDWHGAMFDIRTGTVLCLPATRPMRVYPVRIDDGDIYVNVE